MKINHFLLFILFFIQISCSTSYGRKKEFGNLEVYYSKEIQVQYVDKLGEYFKENELILPQKHAVKITSDENSFILQMILDPNLEEIPDSVMVDIKLLENEIKNIVFDSLSFRIEITDNEFMPLKNDKN